MKTQIISSVIALAAMCTWATAQVQHNNTKREKKEFRFKKNSGKLMVNANAVSVEGYDGNEVVIATWAEHTEYDERAAGLQGINSSGLKDNTGVGLQLTESDGITILSVVNRQKLDSIHLQLPHKIALAIKAPSSWTEGKIVLQDLLADIEVSNTFGDVKLHQVTGPMTVKTVHGNIEAVLDKPVKGPVSLVSTLGFIDVAVPISTPANLELRTTLGEIFAAEELNIDLKPVVANRKEPTIVLANTKAYVNTDSLSNEIAANMQSQGWLDSIGTVVEEAMESANVALESAFSELPQSFTISGSSNRIQGTINGGGENINLRTTNGKIYLRTTKK